MLGGRRAADGARNGGMASCWDDRGRYASRERILSRCVRYRIRLEAEAQGQ